MRYLTACRLSMLFCWSVFPLSLCNEEDMYHWSEWSPEAKNCERKCSQPNGIKVWTRECKKCNKTSLNCRVPVNSDHNCEGQSEKVTQCYVGAECTGAGYYTGQWSPWALQNDCPEKPTPEERAKNLSQLWTRTCESTSKSDVKFECPELNDMKTYKKIPCKCLQNPSRQGPSNAHQHRVRRSRVIRETPKWSQWGEWKCDRDCTEGVLAERRRECLNGKSALECLVESKGVAEVERQPCVEDTVVICHKFWSAWGDWQDCRVTCGEGGVQQRSRLCEGFGRPCEGKGLRTRPCEGLPPCPEAQSQGQVNQVGQGTWTAWEPWSPFCSKTCGTGIRIRTRVCSNPGNCVGEKEESTTCKMEECPRVTQTGWSKWSDWTCDRTCGPATGMRTRQCQLTDGECQGSDAERKVGVCGDVTCPGENEESSDVTQTKTSSRRIKVRAIPNKGTTASFGATTTKSFPIGQTRPVSSETLVNGYNMQVKNESNTTHRNHINGTIMNRKDSNGQSKTENEANATDLEGGVSDGVNITIDMEEDYELINGSTLNDFLPLIKHHMMKTLNSYEVKGGDDLTLSCMHKYLGHMSSQVDNMTITWSHNGKPMTRLTNTMGVMYLVSVNPSHSGVYLCHASTPADGNVSASNVTLDVFTVAIKSARPSITAVLKQKVPLECNSRYLASVYPSVSSYWSHNGELMRLSGRTEKDHRTYRLSIGAFTYAGFWKCETVHEETERKWVTNLIHLKVIESYDDSNVLLDLVIGLIGAIAFSALCACMPFLLCAKAK